jgi:hypothetical protein
MNESLSWLLPPLQHIPLPLFHQICNVAPSSLAQASLRLMYLLGSMFAASC